MKYRVKSEHILWFLGFQEANQVFLCLEEKNLDKKYT